MYGSSADHPVVRYYDVSFALGSPDEIPWYLAEVRRQGSPVLDLACGTGRLSLEFARNGIDTVALDSSAGMLQLFGQKLLKEPLSVQRRIQLERQATHDSAIKGSFQTVVCCDAFFHNLTPDDERSCLNAINRHLRPGGYLLFNIHNSPNPDFPHWVSSPEAAQFHKRGEYPIPGTKNTLHIEEASTHDPHDQTIESRLRFQVIDQEGRCIEQSESSWKTRYLCKYEAIYLLELCGFEIESLVGTYRDGPVTTGSQLVFTARRR